MAFQSAALKTLVWGETERENERAREWGKDGEIFNVNKGGYAFDRANINADIANDILQQQKNRVRHSYESILIVAVQPSPDLTAGRIEMC